MNYCKQKPAVITYRKFKNFSNIAFMKDLEEHLNMIIFLLYFLKETVNIILEKDAPTKKKYVRGNHTISQPSTLYC